MFQIRGTDTSVIDQITRLGVSSAVLSEGLDELAFVLGSLSDLPAGGIVADLSVARGLAYYTGTVYEGKFTGWPGYGSICSGGRYDNLAGSFVRRSLPGVGMSIGLTRIFAKLVAEGFLRTGPSCPSDVLVVVPSDERYASRKGIPFVWFPPFENGKPHEVKEWPPASSARPTPGHGSGRAARSWRRIYAGGVQPPWLRRNSRDAGD